LLGETPATSYLDPEFQFDHAYSYKVRVVFKESDQTAESDDSLPAQITPRDTFPPTAPTGVNAVYAVRAVELIWNASTEPDLAGYNVYRREEPGAFQRINRQLLPTPIYRDPSVEPGRHYAYRVTAVDLANNESPPSAESFVESR
jgi:hypothetical protein